MIISKVFNEFKIIETQVKIKKNIKKNFLVLKNFMFKEIFSFSKVSWRIKAQINKVLEWGKSNDK